MEENGRRWCCVIGMRNVAHEAPPTDHLIRFKKMDLEVFLSFISFIIYCVEYIYTCIEIKASIVSHPCFVTS